MSMSEEKRLIFLHIPKSGGTTLHHIIRRNYKRRHIYDIRTPVLKDSVARFKALSEQRKQNILCLKGHMGYGLHLCFKEDFSYITIVRNPVDRVVSHYYYVRRIPNHYLHKKVMESSMSLEDYVDSRISDELYNGHTRLLACTDGLGIGFDQKEELDRSDLETALRHLQEKFILSAPMEEYDLFLIKIQELLNWKTIYYAKQNITRTRPPLDDISERVIQKIRKNNELDMELYENVRDNFKKQITGEEDLAGYMKGNKYYTWISLPYRTVDGLLKKIYKKMRI